MDSRIELFGHSVHPMLIVFPLGLLATSFIFDLIYLGTGNPEWGTVSFWMIVGGIVGGLIAGVFGLLDYLAIPKGTRARRIGLMHGAANIGALLLFIWSATLRWEAYEYPGGGAIFLSLLGVLLALLGGWLGGELVERLGVGVQEGAHINATSSLKRPPEPEYTPRTQEEIEREQRIH